MVAALQRFEQPKSCPAFLDIEYNQYHLNKQGANLAASTFQATMNSAGYSRPYPYAPLEMGRGWISDYVYSKPAELPAGVIGWQYENDKYAHHGWDASVFDAALLGKIDSTRWSLDNMDIVVIIRRLGNGKYYRLNLLDGTCNHLVNPDAVSTCIADLKAAGIPYAQDSIDNITGYVEI